MQLMADVMNLPIRIHSSEQTCALGAAMFAATVAGIYPKVEDAMHAMGQALMPNINPMLNGPRSMKSAMGFIKSLGLLSKTKLLKQ